MSSFNLKPNSNQQGNFPDAPKIDFNKINQQVQEDNTPAIISLIVDLGVHTPDMNVRDTAETEFKTREEAEDYLEEIMNLKGKTEGAKFKISEEGDKFKINGEIYQPKDSQQIAIFADLVENVVDYGDEIGKKPYRIMLNKTFNGELKGFSLSVVPPQNGGNLWTFAGNSMLTKLAKATKQEYIIDGSDKEKLNDIGYILGKSIMADVKKNTKGDNTYINVSGVSSLPKSLEKTVDYSLVTPVGISFDTATVEDLEKAQLRGNIFKKIKAAKNYEGSAISKAIQEFEAKSGSGQKDKTDGDYEKPEVNAVNDDDDF